MANEKAFFLKQLAELDPFQTPLIGSQVYNYEEYKKDFLKNDVNKKIFSLCYIMQAYNNEYIEYKLKRYPLAVLSQVVLWTNRLCNNKDISNIWVNKGCCFGNSERSYERSVVIALVIAKMKCENKITSDNDYLITSLVEQLKIKGYDGLIYKFINFITDDVLNQNYCGNKNQNINEDTNDILSNINSNVQTLVDNLVPKKEIPQFKKSILNISNEKIEELFFLLIKEKVLLNGIEDLGDFKYYFGYSSIQPKCKLIFKGNKFILHYLFEEYYKDNVTKEIKDKITEIFVDEFGNPVVLPKRKRVESFVLDEINKFFATL